MDVPKSCPVCSGARHPCFQAKLLNKYQVHYYYCATCGLVQTEDPYWLDEAYSSAIADSDTGLVARNLHIANRLAVLLYFCFKPDAQYVEYAGGYGLLTRLMRDNGFNFYWHDPYCGNIFAKGFEWAHLEPKPESCAVTAFEVLEHVMDPAGFIQDALREANASSIVLSTQLYEGEPPRPETWWYYALESGQHVSFFRRDTLLRLANRLNLRLYTNGWIHILTPEHINPLWFRVLCSRIAPLLSFYVQRRQRSNTMEDREIIAGKMSGSGSCAGDNNQR